MPSFSRRNKSSSVSASSVVTTTPPVPQVQAVTTLISSQLRPSSSVNTDPDTISITGSSTRNVTISTPKSVLETGIATQATLTMNDSSSGDSGMTRSPKVKRTVGTNKDTSIDHATNGGRGVGLANPQMSQAGRRMLDLVNGLHSTGYILSILPH